MTKNVRQVNVDEVISAEGLKMLTEDKVGLSIYRKDEENSLKLKCLTRTYKKNKSFYLNFNLILLYEMSYKGI